MSPSSATDIEIVALDRAEVVLEPWAWRFAVERRGEIDRHFAEFQRRRSAVWNGRILLLHRCAIASGILRGACFETDYASFCAWRDWHFPDSDVCNFFAAAALKSADGAFLLGEMAASTANAGLLTFPCGTPEPGDLNEGGALELATHLGRELLEETGIDIGELAAAPGWTMVRDGRYLALVKQLTAPQTAEALRARMTAYIAGEQNPEFTAVRIVRSRSDFDPAMPRFVTAYLTHFFGV
jgi:8-oxo-dGTP pyrophosphatase MutT (NUDIX family)